MGDDRCAPVVNRPSTVNSVLLGYLMSQVPTNRQARVMTFVNLVASGLSALVPLFAGVALQRIDVGPIVAGGVVVLAAAVAMCALNPKLREIPAPERWSETRL